MSPKVNFQFYNSISPRYVELLFLPLEEARWYETGEMRDLLRSGGLDVEGSDIVDRNVDAWSLAAMGQTRFEFRGRARVKMFRLTRLGKQVVDIYSTNHELFHDLIHYIFYSTWHRSHDIKKARFWLYSSVSDALWAGAPATTDSFALTNKLQIESSQVFPGYAPAFSERSVTAVFPWLSALMPPFLSKCDNRSQLCSKRRNLCTPQLFHLATDLVYRIDGLRYGTSLAIDDKHIELICKICLLDLHRFWEMAELTKLSIRGFEIRKGQWGTSIALEQPVSWIGLPDFGDLASREENSNGLEGEIT